MLSSSSIHFHDEVIPVVVKEGTKFGTFEMQVCKTSMIPHPLQINLMIDQSGSMDEKCSDGNTKIDQIKHVTNNILRYIAKNCLDGNVTVGLYTFNDKVERIFENVVVFDDNLQDLIKLVHKFYAENETNIELALKSLIDLPPHPDRTNIFMSDGDATTGETRPTEFAKFVDTSATNFFVGFGREHNPHIFSNLSEAPKSTYYFVDKIEQSGLAYGEILHATLFKCFRDVKITINNGEIYDWKTNQWVVELLIGNLSGDTKKTFQIVAADPAAVTIRITGVNIFLESEFEESFATSPQNTANLMNMYYRQKTQEFLYLARTGQENEDLKTRIAEFTKEMKEYMRIHDLMQDPLFKNLCDDLVIVYKTMGTRFGVMYSAARQTSQGEERTFNVWDTPHSRHSWASEAGDSIMDVHRMTMDSPYFTAERTAIMRDVSSPMEYTLPDGSLYFPELEAFSDTTPLSLEDLATPLQRPSFTRSASE
jgi:hypothetical protein